MKCLILFAVQTFFRLQIEMAKLFPVRDVLTANCFRKTAVHLWMIQLLTYRFFDQNTSVNLRLGPGLD